MSANEIARLISLAADGDNEAFKKLYVKTARGVYAFLRTYFHNHFDTEDAVQTVYLKIKQNADKFKPGTNGRAWILQIAKNHALDVLRKERYDRPLEDAHAVSVDDTPTDGTVISVMQKVLSEEEQRIVTLHVLWGYKHREIAEIMEMPTGTVTSKYKRSVEKLKNALKEVR